jgi:MFS family permease
MSTTAVAAAVPHRTSTFKVLAAASIGNALEWYDILVYGYFAVTISKLFFPTADPTTALLLTFGTFGVSYLVRPLGAIVLGAYADRNGRRAAMLLSIVIMTIGTGLMAIMPTYKTIGFAAPLILVLLRLAQGLALGGEYGGAATYVAEHAADNKRGYATSWIQTTATLGFFLALVVIGVCRYAMEAKTFIDWGWRIPFILSIALLAISIYIRLKLNESPLFRRMKAQGKGSKSPLKDSFLKYPNNKYVALALLGATAGQGVVWYTGQFYALFFLQITLKLDFIPTYALIALSLVIGTPFFLVFGALSDRIGRLRIILAGCLIAALTYFPLFKGLTHFVNPDLEQYQQRTAISVAAADCNFHIFIGPWSKQTPCDRAKDFLTKSGLSFSSVPAVPGEAVVTKIGDIELKGWDPAKYAEALKTTGYPPKADLGKVNWVMTELLLVVMVIYVTMVYGPIAAFLVELFPTRIRYTSMSLPYHIGNGWFGGMLPLLATALVAWAGDIYYGLWYPIWVSILTVVVGFFFLKETKDTNIHTEH